MESYQKFNTAFSIGSFALPWNAIMLALGILTAVAVSEILVKKRKAYKDLALDACIVGILAGLVGARLFAALSGKIAFSQFFSLANTGLNLTGALLFSGVAITVYARIKKLDIDEVFEILLPGVFFGLAVGRWSDFFLCDGLGAIAGDSVPKFFPLVTFTREYFTDHRTVAYSIFFLDFLICAGLGTAALLLPKKLPKGRTAMLTVIVYLLAEFILEWLRDGSMRQIVFGDVRFNQIVLIALLLFFTALALYRTRQSADRPDEAHSSVSGGEPDMPEEREQSDASEVTEGSEFSEMQGEFDGEIGGGEDSDGGEGDSDGGDGDSDGGGDE